MLIHGDCLDVMAGMEPESVDAVVTDPPYGLEFMGKEWDKIRPTLGNWNDEKWAGKGLTQKQGAATEGRRTGVHSLVGATPSFSSGLNRRCLTCRKWQSGGSPCRCETPQWEARADYRAQAMSTWHQQWAEAAYRVAKPSAYLLAFGGTRTVHRMTVALEDAGWIIRDMLVWAYASGFPKSKASLKPAWEPIVLARKPGPLRDLAIDACRIPAQVGYVQPEQGEGYETGLHGDYLSRAGKRPFHYADERPYVVSGPTAIMDAWDNEGNLCGSCAEAADSQARRGAPATKASTTRKPAAQQPRDKETSGDTSRRGTGCSHGMTAASAGSSSSIDESGNRPTDPSLPGSSSTISTRTSSTTDSKTCTCCGGPITPTTTSGTLSDTATAQRAATTSESTESASGRWPSNIVLTDPIFDGGWEGVVGGGEASVSSGGGLHNGDKYGGGFAPPGVERIGLGDSGTYSRYFIIPKADRSDREPVLGGLPEQHIALNADGTPSDFMGQKSCGLCGEKWINPDGLPKCHHGKDHMIRTPQHRSRQNVHPTVKPTDLMRHLVRLVTPTGGTVLDPFGGSGTTALACELEGFPWVLIEREAEYVKIAEARLNGTQRGLGLDVA